MLASQLGRIVLGVSAASEDEMIAGPDSDGSYGALDGLVAEAAAQVRDGSKDRDRRGRSTRATTDPRPPVIRPS